MRRALQVVLTLVALTPFVVGAVNLWFGAAMHMPAEHVTPEIDSQIRFFAVWFMAAGALGLYMVPHIERYRTLFTLQFGMMGLAALARVASGLAVGWPDGTMMGAMVFEGALVLLVPWQAAVARQAGV
ncbi:MAG: DUF4345 domain-containing protein [Myxococcota bacterium]